MTLSPFCIHSHSRTAFIDDLREAAGLRPGQLITLQVFLPCGDGVAELSAVVEKRINQLYGRQYPVLDLCTLTSSEAKRMQSLVAETVQSARKSAAQGAVVLTGRRAGVGITLQDVDATVMLNNCKTESLYVQQIFRSMSSRSKAGASSDGSSSGGISPATKTGIVADTNITRVLKSLGSSFAAPDSSEDEHLECAVDLLHGGLLQVHGRTFSSRQDAQRFVEEAALTSKEPFNKLKISIRDAVDTAADWVAQGGCSSGGGATASAAPQAAASAAGSGILCGYDTKKGPCKNKVKTAGARCYAHREKAAAAPAVGSSSAASSSSAERAASTAAGTDYGEGSCTSDAEEDAVGDHNPNAGPWRRGYRWTTGKIRSHNYRQHINKTSRHADHILELQLVAAEMAYFNISQADAAQIEEACNSEANIESRGQGVNRTKKTLTQTSMRDGIADGLDGWKNDKIQRDKALELAQLCTAGSVAQQVFQQVAERADVRVVAFELQRNWRHVKGQLGETAWMRNIEVLRAKGRTGYNKKGAPIQPLADPLLRGQQQVLREE